MKYCDHDMSEGLISPNDREIAINFFRRPRNCKIYQQTTAKIPTNNIAVFSTITFNNLYKFNINSLLFKQPNITSQLYIHSHSHSHCCSKAYNIQQKDKRRLVIDPCAYPQLTLLKPFQREVLYFLQLSRPLGHFQN